MIPLTMGRDQHALYKRLNALLGENVGPKISATNPWRKLNPLKKEIKASIARKKIDACDTIPKVSFPENLPITRRKKLKSSDARFKKIRW